MEEEKEEKKESKEECAKDGKKCGCKSRICPCKSIVFYRKARKTAVIWIRHFAANTNARRM